MIQIENVSKSFAGQVLFENVSFRINNRERIGLVGRNGHGKTTLFRMLIGEETVDSGSIIIPKNYRIGYVVQELVFTQPTVLKEAAQGLLSQEADHFWKVEKILSGLGFSYSDMHRPPLEFSGGYQMRINLAKVLVSDPDLLLLDEPTNFLDITSIRWVEQFFQSWPREVFLITHDRSFMDRVVTHVLGLHRQKSRKVSGDTRKYYEQIAQDEEIYEKTRLNDERKRKEIELFISRFRAKARLAGMVQSRIKTLEKTQKKEKLDNIKNLDFTFRIASFQGKHMARIEDLSFGYEKNQPLFEKLDLTVYAKDRVCIIGPNGKGKTTLIKTLGGALKPHAGKVTYSPQTMVGVFEQSRIGSLIDNRTVEEEILSADPDGDRQRTRNICGMMMFEQDMALKKTKILSGGEKSRVMLGKLIVTPTNFLLLDEPTNHLDMPTCDALLEAIDAFDGAIIMVTHNEMFLHHVANRLIVFQNNQAEVFEGSYRDFLERQGWSGENREEAPHKEVLSKANPIQLDRKELKRKKSELIARKSREIKPIERDIQKLEKSIETSEAELVGLHQIMQEASLVGDHKKIRELSISLPKLQKKIDTEFEELEQKIQLQEEKMAYFNQLLTDLEV